MAPLFGQRQNKVPEELATSTNQSQTENYSSNPVTMSGSSDYRNSSGNRHHQNSTSNHSHHHHQNGPKCNTIPPPLPVRSHQQPQSGPNPISDTAAIRKYLVLLQDCLAIKFAPLVNGHQSHSYPFAFNINEVATHNGSRKMSGVSGGSSLSSNTPHGQSSHHHDDEEDDDLLLSSHLSSHLHSSSGNGKVKCGNNSITETEKLPNNNGNRSSFMQTHPKSTMHHRQEQFHLMQSFPSPGKKLSRPASANFNGSVLGSNTAEVDHSLHALYLYKGFKEANSQCHWNSALSETFRNIQYKGYIVPSTILVGAFPKFLSTMRTAWSRQMLKSPPGYRIEFLGEIEEVIADPIQKGQFAPLSDSLCWAILELTSLGHEAFVDSIMSALQLAFPTMSCPSRELVFQTLEKLIKERKVYQTSRGYFLVTPEIYRYMVSANFHEFDGATQLLNCNSEAITLDALLHPRFSDQDKLSFSHQSWVSTGDHNQCSSTSTGEDFIEVPAATAVPSPKLKRHNSLKLIRQRDVAVTQMSGSAGHNRRYSLRLPKSKSCGRMNESDEEVKIRSKGKSSTIEHISRAMRSLRTANNSGGGVEGVDCEKGKKNKSLLSKLFPFRRSTSKPRNEKITTNLTETSAAVEPMSGSSSANSTITSASLSPPTITKHSENVKESAKFISTQTQTTNSTEQLCVPSISVSTSKSISSSHPNTDAVVEKLPGRASAVDSSSFKPEHSSENNMMNHHQHVRYRSKDSVNGDDSHQTRSSSRRSMSILDESPLYDVLNDDVPTPPPNTNGGLHPHHHLLCQQNLFHVSPNFQVGCPVGPPTFPSFHHNHHNRGGSSRCSTMSSQETSSLGYGSQGHPSFSSNHYSPNLDSGMASSSSFGFYNGEGSVPSSSHSPCGMNSLNYGNTGKHSANFITHAKPSSYSSQRYKNSYEWYKKRYPNYVSPVGDRSSPLYASLTAPRSKSRSRPTYETLLTPINGKHGVDGLIQTAEERNTCNNSSSQTATKANSNNNKKHSMISETNNDNNVSTTTVSQAVKSTTNMELELLLPLGKIMKAALHAKKDAIRDAWLKDELGPSYAQYANKDQSKSNSTNGVNIDKNCSNNNESIKVNLNGSGAKLRVGEPTTKTEVTTVVNNNGVIETHFDSSSGPNPSPSLADMKSTVEIKTVGGVADIVLVNKKTGEERKIGNDSHNGNSNNSQTHE